MATFISLITETQQGEENIRDSVARAARFEELAREFGVTIQGLYWTVGSVDGVLVLEGPDAETVTALIYRLTSGGAVRAQTMHAYGAEEMRAILARAGV